MQTSVAGALGGLAGGLLLSGAMIVGRRIGLLHKTLAEHSEDWLDRMFDARRRVGARAVTLAEQANHLGAAVAFGAGYGTIRPYLPIPSALAGLLYGGGLYAVNIAGIAPRIGLTRGERQEPVSVVGQRLAMHALFGVVTAVIAETLMSPSVRHRRR